MTTGGSVQTTLKVRTAAIPLDPLVGGKVEIGDRKLGCLTPCTYALSPQIPQNRKVIGG